MNRRRRDGNAVGARTRPQLLALVFPKTSGHILRANYDHFRRKLLWYQIFVSIEACHQNAD